NERLKEYKVDPLDYENVKHFSSNDSLISVANYNLTELAKLLSDFFAKPIIFFGKDNASYNFELPIVDFYNLIKVLKEKYG
ncbi:MAG: hypothetical protein N2517_07840, partial [Ignavibacteria bacterium]|nr:hypothetical protein [Ignavibacteria bacterium]